MRYRWLPVAAVLLSAGRPLAAADFFHLFPPTIAPQRLLASGRAAQFRLGDGVELLRPGSVSAGGFHLNLDLEDVVGPSTQGALSIGPRREDLRRGTRAELAIGVSLVTMTTFALPSFTNGPSQSFHFTNEGFFGRNTYAGGADKTSHFVGYNVVSRELAILYERFGYSPGQSRLYGFLVSTVAGFATELGDGTTHFGFSYEDLVFDALGAGAAALISAHAADDLIGFRGGPVIGQEPPRCCRLPNSPHDYSRDIYTADLKLAGLARRLRWDPGVARFLLLSVTYGTKGYPFALAEQRERQVGIEVGLSPGEILYALGVGQEGYWGIVLHAIFDNVRVPYSAVGFRYDLNHGRWRGPDAGDSFPAP